MVFSIFLLQTLHDYDILEMVVSTGSTTAFHNFEQSRNKKSRIKKIGSQRPFLHIEFFAIKNTIRVLQRKTRDKKKRWSEPLFTH